MKKFIALLVIASALVISCSNKSVSFKVVAVNKDTITTQRINSTIRMGEIFIIKGHSMVKNDTLTMISTKDFSKINVQNAGTCRPF